MKLNPLLLCLIFSLSGILLSCGRKPVTQSTVIDPVVQKPHWVESKPASSIYFYGIGVAQKSAGNSDYLETAKKNALNDLASEIKVNVSSNSILYTLERDYKFQSEFIETIRTSTDEDLEGYEIADNWQNDQQYWVFYRLNRADYYAAKEAEKQSVLKNAADFYKSGLKAWEDQQVSSAFDLQFRALSVLKPYWAESNEYIIDNQELLLDNAILQKIQGMAASILLKAQPDQIKLNLDNRFHQICIVTAYDRNSGKGLGSIPVLSTFKSAAGIDRSQEQTDASGNVSISIDQPDLQSSYNELSVSVELEKLFDPRALDAEMRLLVKGLPSPVLKVPIQLQRPVFYLESKEQNLNQRQLLSHLKDHLSNEIIKNGLPVSQDRSQADIIVKIEGKTRNGGESNGFSIAYLDMGVKFTDPSGRNIYYDQSFNDVKGVSNTTERAGLKAFDNGRDRMDRTFMEKALKAII